MKKKIKTSLGNSNFLLNTPFRHAHILSIFCNTGPKYIVPVFQPFLTYGRHH